MFFWAGRRIVEMVKENLRPSDILTKKAFENAIRVNGAIGGSTNAVLHLLALSRRVRRRYTSLSQPFFSHAHTLLWLSCLCFLVKGRN